VLDDAKNILKRGWPAIAILVGAAVTLSTPSVQAHVRSLVIMVPIVWGAGLALAIRFGRTRVAWSLVVLALAKIAVGQDAATGLAAATLAPLAIAGILVTNSIAPASARGLVRLAGLVAVVITVQRGLPWVPDGVWARLGGPTGIAFVDQPLAVPAGPLIAGIVALVVGAVVMARRRSPLDAAIVTGVAVSLGCLSARLDADVRDSLALLVVAGLLFATIESSWDLAFRDRLTGLLGRRALDETLAEQGRRYAVAMIDVDHFKKFNDRHGHDAGDRVLQAVARRLDRVTGGGRAYRYGGEEFTIVFPRRSAADAQEHLEALRKAIRETRVTLPRRAGAKPTKSERRVSVTVSIGVAERSDALPTPDAVIKEADRALYRAKKAGRNRVEVA
jgi:diguanylate cyclase (GGDEF)-like protein